ncbi:MAG: hypothetical protein M1113_03440 [Candidatus Thermoplasmatota archaeon]|nr:hypothetical protein [Candidatus Thermoplasmatota archaeon]
MPYYNPRIKNTSYHYRYTGKKEGGETNKVRSVLPRRSLVHGPFIPLTGIVNAIGIEEMLKKHLTENEAVQIVAMAISKVARPLPVSSLETGFEDTSLSRSMNVKNLESRRISDLLDKISGW